MQPRVLARKLAEGAGSKPAHGLVAASGLCVLTRDRAITCGTMSGEAGMEFRPPCLRTELALPRRSVHPGSCRASPGVRRPGRRRSTEDAPPRLLVRWRYCIARPHPLAASAATACRRFGAAGDRPTVTAPARRAAGRCVSKGRKLPLRGLADAATFDPPAAVGPLKCTARLRAPRRYSRGVLLVARRNPTIVVGGLSNCAVELSDRLRSAFAEDRGGQGSAGEAVLPDEATTGRHYVSLRRSTVPAGRVRQQPRARGPLLRVADKHVDALLDALAAHASRPSGKALSRPWSNAKATLSL